MDRDVTFDYLMPSLALSIFDIHCDSRRLGNRPKVLNGEATHLPN
jgi:hypothetical protein